MSLISSDITGGFCSGISTFRKLVALLEAKVELVGNGLRLKDAVVLLGGTSELLCWFAMDTRTDCGPILPGGREETGGNI